MRRLLTIATVVGFTLGCAGLMPEPVPASHVDYVGSWTGPDTILNIEQSGACHYKYDGGPSVELTMPCVEWTANSFAIGMGPAKKLFTVDEAPKQSRKGKGWMMTVDGVELRRNN